MIKILNLEIIYRFNCRYKRDDSARLTSQNVALMRQSNLIHSLGNAGHEKSFELLKGIIESKHAPTLLRRSAVHSLRGYNTDEVHSYVSSLRINNFQSILVLRQIC